MDGQNVAPKVPQYMYFNRIFEDLLECLQMEHDRLLSLKESFQEILPTRNIGHTPFNAPSGNSTPLANCMNDVLLPTVAVAAPLANANDEQPESESSSDESSDTSSDSDDLETLSDDSDDEPISNIQKINLLFSGLEDVNYDTPEEDIYVTSYSLGGA
jgi:hypothetical protein